MAALAALPSASVVLVVTRAATSGRAGGIAAAAGIVAGDLVFASLAILGLDAVAETMGGVFTLVRYLGAAYLFWFGFTLMTNREADDSGTIDRWRQGGPTAGFIAGLLLTLGDIKAILFYASLFPLFMEPMGSGSGEIALILAITVVAVGGVKMVYAVLAGRIVELAQGRGFPTWGRKVAGGLLMGTAGFLVAKT